MSVKYQTVDPDEISKFSAVSENWWDEHGPFAPIHKINPARLRYMKSVICDHANRDPKALNALTGLKILDVGCGGGLVCEPMARMGATMTGLDADGNAIAAARAHAQKSELDITYINAATTDLPKQHKGTYDVVLALEIVEHVSDVETFVQSCADLCKPGGLIIFSTLNKTIKSLALAKVAAEYILRWVPAGTHDWKKFLRPATLSAALRNAGIEPFEAKGLVFNPLKNEFLISDTDLDVNYFIAARKG